MANIHCACTGNKIRFKKKSPNKAMANASATIIGHQGTGMGPIYQQSYMLRRWYTKRAEENTAHKTCTRYK